MLSCMPPETLCNGPAEGGAADAGDASVHDGGGGAGGGDADAGNAGGASGDAAGDGAPGDGGPTGPYCANLQTDNANCGVCGHPCTGEHTCNAGKCGLTCGPGQIACIAGDTCIPMGTCCSLADCPVTGEICPVPGGACQCPGGQTVCPATNSCIPSSACCTDMDCAALAGATCPTPGQSCQCATGGKACLSTKSCIPQTSCCTQAGMCCDDMLGKSCSGATDEGPLTLGQMVSVQGVLTAAGEEDWIKVTFTNESQTTLDAHIVFTTNPSNEFVFDVSSDCLGTLRACGEGGLCKGKTEWEVKYTGGDPTGITWQPIALGATFIRVYRASGAPTCDQWALSISE
jgi:hypothetical protein